MYYNTTNEQGQTLIDFQQAVKMQDKFILTLWRKSKFQELSPERFEAVMPHTPLTSIRRAFNDLENAGLIEKTGRKAIGKYGRNVNLYKLVEVKS